MTFIHGSLACVLLTASATYAETTFSFTNASSSTTSGVSLAWAEPVDTAHNAINTDTETAFSLILFNMWAVSCGYTAGKDSLLTSYRLKIIDFR